MADDKNAHDDAGSEECSYCSLCGDPLSGSDLFCAGCGAPAGEGHESAGGE